jgi:aryl-alcohol dehydrogenase-like predicted oxidoreductase
VEAAEFMTKLILGTASFGKPYGIKGDPVPDEREIERIARTAWDGGIRIIHTSWQYRVPKICEAIFGEFEKIRKDRYNPKVLWCNHQQGMSIYEFKDWALSPCGPESEFVQLPLNIINREAVQWAVDFRARGVSVHARSVFLQGLLLMDELPSWVNGQARAHIKLFHHVCRKEDYEPYEAALGWVLGLDEIDKVIVGVNSARQLEQLLKVSPLKWDYDFSITDENVLDPRKWPES